MKKKLLDMTVRQAIWEYGGWMYGAWAVYSFFLLCLYPGQATPLPLLLIWLFFLPVSVSWWIISGKYECLGDLPEYKDK